MEGKLGIDGANRSLKSGIITIGGANRSPKEGYAGINGVNRKVFSGKPAGALYWDGDECVEKTGGWGIYAYSGYQKLVYEKQSDGIYARAYGTTSDDTNNHINIYPINNINYSGYSKICVELDAVEAGFRPYVALGLTDNPVTPWPSMPGSIRADGTSGHKYLELSIPAGSTKKICINSPIGTGGAFISAGYAEAWIRRIWLE